PGLDTAFLFPASRWRPHQPRQLPPPRVGSGPSRPPASRSLGADDRAHCGALAYGVHAGIACKEARWLLAVVGRAAETNLLLAEDYLARNPVGDQGAAGPGAPPAAAARLRTALQSRKGLKRPQTARPERGQSRFPIDSRMRRRGGLAHDELGRKDRPLV